jgi:hypothetical protein
MRQVTAHPWEAMRTDESRRVEMVLNDAGFPNADAYRYNSASLRVRVIAPGFEGLSVDQRYGMVEPILEKLPDRTQADILQLLIFAPSDLALEETAKGLRNRALNMEFEEPSPSIL